MDLKIVVNLGYPSFWPRLNLSFSDRLSFALSLASRRSFSKWSACKVSSVSRQRTLDNGVAYAWRHIAGSLALRSVSMTRTKKQSTGAAVREIRRRTRRKFAPEEKIRIVLEGLRGEQSISELCRREGIV